MEAIQSITKENAYVMGLDGQVGTIEEGRMADIILLDADPIADISVLKAGAHVTMVIKDGLVVDGDSLSPNNEPLGFNQLGF